tara:strand:+ start:6298 stop:6699 length:402 start_codon:yes stop_codon:yes gene_type:complete
MIAGIYADGTVDRVIDGDTVDVRFGSVVFRVRLVDCWAPEKVARGGDQFEKELGLLAKAAVEIWLPKGSEVRVDVRIDVDGDFGDWLTFGRIVGRLTCDDVDIGEKLIEVGLAAKTKSELRSLIESTRKEAGS